MFFTPYLVVHGKSRIVNGKYRILSPSLPTIASPLSEVDNRSFEARVSASERGSAMLVSEKAMMVVTLTALVLMVTAPIWW